MKRAQAKLLLARETLRRLDRSSIRRVRGGYSATTRSDAAAVDKDATSRTDYTCQSCYEACQSDPDDSATACVGG